MKTDEVTLQKIYDLVLDSNTKISVLDLRMTESNEKIDSLDLRMTESNEKIDSLDLRMTKSNEKIDSLDLRMTKSNEKIDTLDRNMLESFAYLNKRIDSVEQKLEDNEDNIENVFYTGNRRCHKLV